MMLDRYNRKAILILAILMIMYCFSSLNMISTYAQNPSVEFILENSYWGTPPNNIIEPTPGDTNVPFTVVIRNNSSYTLRGVIGYLYLDYPFTDYLTESNVSKASAQPVESGDVFNQTGDILPQGSFTLTFRLNINRTATKGVYFYNLTITYNVQQGSVFVPGDPVTLKIAIRIYNRAPVIYSVTPSSSTVNLVVGETLNFTCEANDPDNDTLFYEWRLDGNLISKEKTFTYNATRDQIGSHTLELEVTDGNLSATNAWTIIVSELVKTTIKTSSQYLYAGYDNRITINITNNVWTGVVRVTISVPQPLVLFGNSSWVFENVTPNITLSISVSIYAPEAYIGQTTQIALTLSYDDRYGNTYNENINVGFVIRGKIIIKVYDVIVSPNPVSPGAKISISGTILNMGNIKALFVNVSILPADHLLLTFESTSYIGDVDANSPVPFTVSAIVRSDAPEGTCSATIRVYYVDDLYNSHFYDLIVHFEVRPTQRESTSHEEENPIISFILQGGWAVIAIIVASAISLGYYYRRRRS